MHMHTHMSTAVHPAAPARQQLFKPQMPLVQIRLRSQTDDDAGGRASHAADPSAAGGGPPGSASARERHLASEWDPAAAAVGVGVSRTSNVTSTSTSTSPPRTLSIRSKPKPRPPAVPVASAIEKALLHTFASRQQRPLQATLMQAYDMQPLAALPRRPLHTPLHTLEHHSGLQPARPSLSAMHASANKASSLAPRVSSAANHRRVAQELLMGSTLPWTKLPHAQPHDEEFLTKLPPARSAAEWQQLSRKPILASMAPPSSPRGLGTITPQPD